jgi:hypothetical protein
MESFGFAVRGGVLRASRKFRNGTPMKHLLAAAAALSLLGGSAALADDHRGDDHMHGHDQHMAPPMARGNHWSRGQRLPSSYRTRSHYVDYRAHHLRAPPRGYRWVQADDNFVLVAATTGLIASIIAANQ